MQQIDTRSTTAMSLSNVLEEDLQKSKVEKQTEKATVDGKQFTISKQIYRLKRLQQLVHHRKRQFIKAVKQKKQS